MELLVGTQSCFPKNLLLSASILALWPPQGSQAALHIQKIPEQPQKNQDLLLFLEGVPDSFQDFTWYLGEEPHGGTMLFTYIPGLQRPQRDGNAMGQRDAVGFRNGSMLLRRVQPSDSGTYHVAVTVNPAWTMRAKTEVQVAGPPPQRSQSWTPARRPVTGPRPAPSSAPGDNNVYEVMPSPVLLVSPLSDLRPMSPAMLSQVPLSPGGQVPWGWCLWSSPSPVCQGLPLGVTCWVTPTSPTSRVP
uniref:Immunoglobulin V-set domain-containing protein n=1 Tax=Sciurus vulgaris TaxID=55149 RepID=A0A8D2DHS0_SCIVU